eukprot:3010292-Prymnesium_polylepis.1
MWPWPSSLQSSAVSAALNAQPHTPHPTPPARRAPASCPRVCERPHRAAPTAPSTGEAAPPSASSARGHTCRATCIRR